MHNEYSEYSGPIALCDGPDNTKAIKEAIDALSAHFVKVNELLTKHTEDIKTFGEVQESTKQAIAKANTDGQKLYAEFIDEKTRQNALILDLTQKVMARGEGGSGHQAKSVGDLFIESQELKDFAPIGKATTGKFQSRPFRLKNITSGGVSGGAGIVPMYVPTPVIPNFPNLMVRDLLSKGTTESDLIYWFQENVFTNNAGVVSEGSLKPQSDITYNRLNCPVVTIAHWMKASKQVLADFKLLQSLIDTRLTFGLKFAEETELLYGDGTGDHCSVWSRKRLRTTRAAKRTDYGDRHHRTGDVAGSLGVLSGERHRAQSTRLVEHHADEGPSASVFVCIADRAEHADDVVGPARCDLGQLPCWGFHGRIVQFGGDLVRSRAKPNFSQHRGSG